nr:hypothetical protein [Tanacetum cinerariifolium]
SMNLQPFRVDIDDLDHQCFCLGYMASAKSVSHRLGGLYCLYCLHETQPFKPPFRIYLSRWQLKRLKELVAHAKEKNIELVYRVVNNMIDRNLFLYGASEFNEGYIEEETSELINVENACAQHPNKSTRIYKMLPHSGFVIGVRFTFGYDESSDDYKVVCDLRAFHWMVHDTPMSYHHYRLTNIVSLDLANETYGEVSPPPLYGGKCDRGISTAFVVSTVHAIKDIDAANEHSSERCTAQGSRVNTAEKEVILPESSDKMDLDRLSYTLDEGIYAIGMGRFQYMILAYAGVGGLGKAMKLMTMTNVGLEAQHDLELSITDQNIISVFTYIAMVVGALTWGFVADR